MTKNDLPGNGLSTKNTWSSRTLWGVAVGLLLVQFLPYLLLWDEAYIRIHDTLEGEWFWYTILVNSGKLFDYSRDTVIEQIMNGLPRRALHTGWSFIVLWIELFGTYWGYIFNNMLAHIAGFFSMFLLLDRHFLPGRKNLTIKLGVSLIFAWIPIFSIFGLTVTAQPLVLYSFLNLYQRRAQWWDFLILWLFPFYSTVVWVGIPILILGGIIFLYQLGERHHWNWKLFWALAGMTVLYFLVNYQLFELTFAPSGFVTHRVEYSYFYDRELSFVGSVLKTLEIFFISHFHAGTVLSLPILLAALLARLNIGRHTQAERVIWTIVAICVFYGFYTWIVYLFGEHFPMLVEYKFERVRIMLPFLWMLAFALALGQLRVKSPRVVGFFLAVQFIVTVASHDEFQHNLRQLAGVPKKPNFKEFVAEDLYHQIDAYIGRPKDSYRVIHLGMKPAASQYNGFYTLDALMAIYGLDYKHQFRKIMKQEIEKDEDIMVYYDEWGNWCYLLSSELGKESSAFLIGKDQERVVEELNIDTRALLDMDGEYLFSAVRILNAEQIGLQFEKTFEHPDSYWKVHLYHVVGPPAMAPGDPTDKF